MKNGPFDNNVAEIAELCHYFLSCAAGRCLKYSIAAIEGVRVHALCKDNWKARCTAIGKRSADRAEAPLGGAPLAGACPKESMHPHALSEQ